MEKEAAPLSRCWFRDRRQLNAVGGTYDELVFNPLLEKDYIQFTRIGVEDESNTCTKIRVYVRGHGYDHPVAEETSITAGVLYWVDWPTYLVPGEELVVRFIGATAADKLAMYFEGWIYDPPLILTNINVTVVPGVG